MYLHDWPAPGTPPTGQGLWFHSADGSMGLSITFGGVADPVKLLESWAPDRLAPLGFSAGDALAPSDRLRALSGDWETRLGHGQDADGNEITYQVTFIADKDRVLETVIYGPSDQWEFAHAVAATTLSLLTDIR